MAIKDMTEKQFKEALARRGWKLEYLWIYSDKLGGGSPIVAYQTKRGIRVDFRQSLAKAIKFFNKLSAEREARQTQTTASVGQ